MTHRAVLLTVTMMLLDLQSGTANYNDGSNMVLLNHHMTYKVVSGALKMCHTGETIYDRQTGALVQVTNSKRDLCDCEPSQHSVFNLQPTTVLLGPSQSQECAHPI